VRKIDSRGGVAEELGVGESVGVGRGVVVAVGVEAAAVSVVLASEVIGVSVSESLRSVVGVAAADPPSRMAPRARAARSRMTRMIWAMNRRLLVGSGF
jgi:hypothetical protein